MSAIVTRIRVVFLVLALCVVLALIAMHTGIQHHEALKCLVGSHCGDMPTA